MKIAIRADGGMSIGMGHIMRTLVLAKELRKTNEVFYICRRDSLSEEQYKIGIDKLKREGFMIEYVDKDKFKQSMESFHGDCIITDSYEVDEEYFEIVKRNFKISGCFDDENICKYYDVDFIINQNPYAHVLNYKVNKDTKLMLGTSYVILRDEFKRVDKPIIKSNIEKVFITVGSTDNENLTEKIIESLKGFKLDVVVGPGFKYKDRIGKLKNNSINLHYNADMYKLMNECDIAISSCGTTIYELGFCGIPTIGIVVVDNQLLTAKYLDELGLIKYESIDNLESAINNMTEEKRKTMSSKSMDLIDGMGYKRAVNNILEICYDKLKS